MSYFHRQQCRLYDFTFVCVLLIGATQAIVGVSATPQSSMYSTVPAQHWEQAMVSGNGRMGVLVFGHPTHERIIFNHERLYEPLYDEPVPPPNVAKALPELRRLLLEGKYVEARVFFAEQAKAAGYEKLLWTDPYHPAMAMLVEQPTEVEYARYSRSTDFATGEVTVNWQASNDEFTRHTFVSRPANVVVQQINSPTGAQVRGSIALVNQDQRSAKEQANSYQPPQIELKNDFLTYRCKYIKSKRGYFSVTRVVVKEGTANVTGNRLEFNAKQVLLLTRVVSVEDWSNADKLYRQTVIAIAKLPADYDQLLETHSEDQREKLPRVRLDLGGGELRRCEQ